MLLPIANIVQPLIDLNEKVISFWHDSVGLSWGLAIIALTCSVRALILPLTFKQVRSMQDLQRLQPQIKKLQERYKDDKQRMNQEMMRFYQEHKVNPLSSCFPLVLQLPFFISLFYLLKSQTFANEVNHAGFLFIPDLTAKATGGVLVALIVLYVATQLAATSVTAFSADKNQRRIMFALPFFFTFFILNFPAGLIVYWITTNLWTFGQQLAVKKLFPKPPPIEVLDEPEAGGARGKPPVAAPAGAAAAVAESGNAGSGGGIMGRLRSVMEQAQAGVQAGGADKGNGRGGKAAGKGASKPDAKPGAKPKDANGAPTRSAAPPPSPRKKKKRARRR